MSDAERAQFEEIREEYRPKLEKLMKELAGVLTDEQKKTREEGLKAGKPRREIRQSLNLSAEQKEKVESIGKELVSVVREELEKMKPILTDRATGKARGAEDRAPRPGPRSPGMCYRELEGPRSDRGAKVEDRDHQGRISTQNP